MLENLNDGVESYEAIATSPLGPHAIVSSAEPSVQAVEELERRLSALGTDKDRFAVLDLGKRSAFLSTTDRIIQSIDQINAKLCSLDVDQLKDFIETLSLDAMNATTVQRAEVTQLGSSSSSACPALPIPPSVSHIPAMLDEDSFLVAKWGKEDPEEQLEMPTDDGVVTLKVAIDGAHRQGVQLQVRLKTGESDKKNGADWTTFSLGDSAEEPLVNGLPAKLLFIGPELGADSICDEQLTSVDVRLVKSNPIDDTNQVVLSDREIISKSEDDGLARMIKSSQQILEKLTGTVSESFHMFNKLQLLEIANESQDQRQAWTKLEEAYSKQRVWRKVASTMIRGIRDQKPDFNRAVDEAVPASWTIKVDGRPTVKDTAAADEEEPQEDAVCMVCFDGSSNDNNKIIFCDGCNAALHQMCYGINEVPEGDFYCDRCEAVQAIASERGEKEDEIPSEDVKNAIKCCLCPQHHGGIKPTTDGRWVHLCCALWAENSLITNLDDMSPINVSKVPVQIPENNLISASWNRQIYSTNEFSQRYPMSNSQNVCSVCNVKGGFVTACTESCGDVFHPLCAWFRGLYFFSELTDPSFSGRERAGLYPSGVNFKIYCAQHGPRPKIDTSTTNAPTEVTAVISQDQDPCSEQKIIRDKYRIKEFDLEYVPGKGGRRRKRKKQKVSAVRSDRATIISKVKDLARDVYDTKKCACCFTPFDLSPLLEAPTQPATENTVSDLPTEPVVVDVHDVNDAPPVVSMSSSEIVIKEESRIESTDVEPAKDKKTFEALLQSYEAICFDCKSVSLPKVVSLPAIDAHVTSEAMVNGDDHTEQSISPTKIVENNDGAAEEEAPPSPRGKVGRKPKSKQAPSKVRFSDRSSSEELQLGSPRNGEAIDGVPSMDIDADTDNKEKELAERMLVAAEANLRKYEDYPDKISCQKCQIALHFKCAFPSREILSAADFDVNNWVCTPCLDEVPDPRCVFCPRRGGFYRSTRTDHYIHQHCVLRSPGNTRIQIDGVVEVLGIPKESKKHLCFLCNRKEGVFSRCSGLGCTTYFHSLCGERSGRVYSKIRFGELVQYCHEHVPEGVERTPQGWWIDEAELFRLHYVLDRSRLIVDMLGRRDKYKRNLSKTEADIFRRRFYRSLDKAKGRKYQDPDGLGDGDSEGEYEDDEENDLMNGAVGMSPEHIKTGKVGKLSKKPCWQDLPPESDITTKTSGGLRVDISGSYVRGDDVKVPALVEVAVAGAVITKRFVKNKESESLQRIMEAIQTNPNLYTSRKDRDTFLKDIQKLLTAVATLPDKLFRTEIGKNLSRLPEHLQVDFEFLQAGRRSRDQVAPESVPKTTSSSAPSSKAGPGRKRKGNDDDNEYEVEPVSKGGKGGKISKVDEKADAGVVEDKGGRKKSAFMPTIEEDLVGAKKTGAKSGPLDKFLVKTAPVPKRSAPIVNAPLPQYVTLVSAERELKSNPLFASLDLAFSDGGIDFSSIAALSGLDALVPPTELDWELCDSPEKRIRLEARILDILNEIDSYEVPVQRAVESSSSSSSSTAAKLNQQSSAASGRSSDRKRTAATFYQPGASSGASKSRHALSPSSSPAQPMRFLAGEFTEIPDDQIPDYDEYVRRRLTIATLKKKLLRHKYLYMAAFEKDFYELLNNGIYVTEGDPEVKYTF